MTRTPDERFRDILTAVQRCLDYRAHLESSDESTALMAYDAILRNLAVIGEAVRALPQDTTSAIPDIPWAAIAGLRNVVIHEYFRVRPDLIIDIVDNELVRLAAAIHAA